MESRPVFESFLRTFNEQVARKEPQAAPSMDDERLSVKAGQCFVSAR